MDSGATGSEKLRAVTYHNVGGAVIGPTEAALVRVMLSGSAERDVGWREFYRRHGTRLMGFIIATMGPDRRGDCDDIFQEMAIRIEKALPRYKHRRDGGFHSWCLKIAHNLCLSAHRVKAGHPTPSELISFDELEQILSANSPDEETLPSPVRSVQEEIMAEAFAKLSPTDQAVIQLRIVYAVLDTEIARRVKKPADQIRKIRNKALTKLKRLFEQIQAKHPRH